METLTRLENWKIYYDRDKKQFTVDFGENFAITGANQKSVEYFIKWRLQKIRKNEI